MRKLQIVSATLGVLLLSVGCAHSQRTVKAGCASCIYHMKDVTGCKLAVKVKGKPYLVSGVDIDDLGDAHDPEGLCNSERKATAKGRVKGDRFEAKSMTLLPKDD